MLGPTMRTRKYFLARVEWGKSTTRPPAKPAWQCGRVMCEGARERGGVRSEQQSCSAVPRCCRCFWLKPQVRRAHTFMAAATIISACVAFSG
jgi:hypothetical protein